MVFSSLVFVFLFLPAILLVYFIIPVKYNAVRNVILLFFSLAFYAYGEPKFIFIMLTSILLNYVFGLAITKYRNQAKLILVLSLVFNIGIIFVFKYLNFAIKNLNQVLPYKLPQTNIMLPIGISFFTFQIMSYVIDVYRFDVPAQKNPLNLGLYISFFPQLIAGPIVRYTTILDQINKRTITVEDFSIGAKRFIVGLSKKVLIANSLAVVADKAFDVTPLPELSVSFAWFGAICYSFQIFFDFSGYSDMAIGMGKMFGFQFLENFQYPYISKTITEFWRRWHISLGTWFRDYVYFPLGGSRVKSRLRLVFNLFVVWFLTGLWHGANWQFIAWGLFYFCILTVEKLLGIPRKVDASPRISILFHIMTLLFVVVGWVLFRSDTITQAVSYLAVMFGIGQNAFFSDITLFYLKEKWFLLTLAVFCSVPASGLLFQRYKDSARYKLVSGTLYIFLLLLNVSTLIVSTHNPFIYFNF